MERKKYIDFHTHTMYSDGIGTPEFNVKLARLSALDYLAITDHDQINGYYEAKAAAEKWQLGIVPGVEISTDRYHILGLGIDVESKGFKEFLRFSAEEQEKVCRARINFFRGLGVPITFDKVKTAFPHSRLGKFNVLMTLDQDKECQEFFMKRYETVLTKEFYDELMKTSKESDKSTAITSERAIREIQGAGGIAIIAHPFKDIKDMAEMDELRRLGLDGLEIQTNFNGRNEPFRKYALENNLLVTYGSDFHGGLFGRPILNNEGENVLYEKLAKALKIK